MERQIGCTVRQSGSTARRHLPARWIVLGVVLWLSLVGGGMAVLSRHMATPGTAAQAPGDWPAASAFPPATDKATLLMWCHPRCPCTRATLEELAELAERTRATVDIQVNFIRPAGTSLGWVQGDLWRQAAAIPGVRVAVDEGSEARLFGVRTSGQTLIFGKDRRLLFSGGLTSGRGHVGENDGLTAAIRQAEAGGGKLETTPVYGCALFTAEENGALAAQEQRNVEPKR